MRAVKRSSEDSSAYLLYVNPQNQKENIAAIDKREFVIGRINTCDIAVTNKVISRKHCIIKCNEDGDWKITDMSLTGTFVNGCRVVRNIPHTLRNEDVITFSSEFTYPFHFFIGNPAVRKKKQTENKSGSGSTSEDVFSGQNLGTRTPSHDTNEISKSESLKLESCIYSTLPCQETIDSDTIKETEAESKCIVQPSDQTGELNSNLEKEATSIKEMKSVHDEQVESYKMDLQVMEFRLNFSNDIIDNLKQELLDLKKVLIEKDQDLSIAKNKLLEKEKNEIEATVQAREDIMDVVETELQCSICNEIVIETIVLKCSHIFCRYCINKWMKKKKECAVCRTAIKEIVNARALDTFINCILEKYSPNSVIQRNQIIQERKAQKSPSVVQGQRQRRSINQQPPRLLETAVLNRGIPENNMNRDRVRRRVRPRLIEGNHIIAIQDESVIEIHDE